MTTELEPTSRRRSDARLNAAAIVEAAKVVFARSGVDAPAKEITDLAGVGVGTMYRAFPLRSDLVAAVVEKEIDACADVAVSLAADNEPGEALAQWVQHYTALVATKQGFAAALHSHDPGLKGIAPYVRQRLEPALQSLLDTAQETGVIRTELTANDVIIAVALLCHPIPDEGVAFNQRLVSVFLNGLRS